MGLEKAVVWLMGVLSLGFGAMLSRMVVALMVVILHPGKRNMATVAVNPRKRWGPEHVARPGFSFRVVIASDPEHCLY